MDNLIERFADRLPASYIEFISKNQEFKGYLGDELGYVNLWDVDVLQEAWEGYKFQESLSDEWFPIGSNRGGEIIVIKLSSPVKELFYIPIITQSEKDAGLYCDDFSKLYDAVKQHSTKPSIKNHKS